MKKEHAFYVSHLQGLTSNRLNEIGKAGTVVSHFGCIGDNSLIRSFTTPYRLNKTNFQSSGVLIPPLIVSSPRVWSKGLLRNRAFSAVISHLDLLQYDSPTPEAAPYIWDKQEARITDN
ncbi:hypothetical protein [Virgibacillus pantothenticus]|uniref:hypothetical protein n=1 Tax=Virgibacillus pantothenticus TaxID=1473 RepID=UPI001BAF3CB6|nr:hypothetical protein [Virgibacillus pantothenticus]